jgi:hypothetical protein
MYFFIVESVTRLKNFVSGEEKNSQPYQALQEKKEKAQPTKSL